MFKIDSTLIEEHLSGVSFSFMTREEVLQLSVVQVKNPQTFDQLDNPTAEGLHDKRMGVSPFDRSSSCLTCGLTSNFCPGHHGHIELVAPIYNPFMIRELYRLMKAKCFYCHRLRIPAHKINTFEQALKLIKAGEIVGSQRLKSLFLSAAKDALSLKLMHQEDDKKTAKVQQALAKGKQGPASLSLKDIRGDLNQFARRFRVEREKMEHELTEMLESVVENEGESLVEKSGSTSIIQKFQLELFKEIWSNVITTRCPHCKKNSPAIRKDGFTKLFVKPLAGKQKAAQAQRQRLGTGVSETETHTVASTHHESRKPSTHNTEVEDSGDERPDVNVDDDADEEFQEGSQQKYISPIEVKGHLDKLWRAEGDLLDLVYGKFEPLSTGGRFETQSLGAKMFFVDLVLVPPTRFRPESEGAHGGAGGGGGRSYLHPHSAMLLKILTCNESMREALLDQSRQAGQPVGNDEKAGKLGITTQRWIQLQEAVNCFMDSSMASKNADKEQGGIRQLLEKKEGMFRMKMMGKRVNYGARSVISPDPYITTDQIGVPVFMARKLTFPESVCSFNVARLRQLVRNGTQTHPGANMIEDEETGQQIHLAHMTAEQREGLAKMLNVGRKVVYRHLTNGDPLLVNRQPTLHRPSIMAHRCRVLPKEQTIRMHYANCSTYNADFDGDEMNLHLPQSYHAFSEAYNLMATHKQYCVPTSGKPIRGLIQDSVVSGVYMTSKDTFLDKEQYNQLVYIGLRELIEMDKIDKIETLQPTVLKPRALWTGKQVISTLLKNIVNKEQEYKRKKLTGLNVSFKAKLAAKEWGPLGREEGDVLFRDNEHLRGTLDKSAFGSSEFGLVHAFYEIYGSEKAGELLTSLARVFTVFLQTHGFTCGLDDLMIDKDFNKKRREAIETGHLEGVKAAAEFCGMRGFEPKEMNLSNRVVFQSKKRFDEDFQRLTDMALPANPFAGKNCIQSGHPVREALEAKMSAAGSDLATLDADLDSAMQGKMNDATSKVLKEIIPQGLIKKFPQNNLSAMVMTGAKGGVVNQTQISALLGQQSLEGRRVPKMQNGKTLPCYLPYDPNPRSSGYISDRFLTGLRPQDFYFHCMAGREGLIDTAVKTSRSGYLQRCLIKQLESLVVHYDMTVRDNDGSVMQFMYGEDGVDVINTKYLDKFEFLEQNFNSLIGSGVDIMRRVDQLSVAEHKKEARKVAKRIKKENPELSNREALERSSDPLLNLFHPQKYFGAISEKMAAGLEKYTKTDCQFVKVKEQPHLLPRKYPPIEPDTFHQTYYMKYMKALANAGENVGTVAAQSVGEPSTQMTLNTFHLAGHGAGNMTLGIPRLKEILMTTPYNIKTPIMKLFFRKDVSLDLEKCQKFANKFQKLKLADIVKDLQVTQSIRANKQGGYCRVYTVELAFDDMKDLHSSLGIDQARLAKLFSDHFIPRLLGEAFKQLKKSEEGAAPEAPANKRLASAARSVGTLKTQTEEETGEALLNEEEKAIKRMGKTEQAEGAMDDDDVVSEHEAELMNEINDEMDGKVKIAKDVRGYDDNDADMEGQVEDNSSESSAGAAKRKPVEANQADADKQAMPMKEAHARYMQYMRDISFDKKENRASVMIALPLDFKKVLMLTLAEQTLDKVLVRSVPNVEKCTLVKPKKEGDEPFLVVQGINFDAFQAHQHILDLDRLETNHSYALKAKYGVEAMRANIVKEIQMVFGVYGISVDKRHLSLIGDFMTFNGDYRAFNRIGMEESSSPFLKMSYETTMKYLVSAAQANERDDMSAPSSAIVLGQVPQVGTGMFDIIQESFA